MDLKILEPHINAGPALTLVLDDRGSAHVSLSLSIGGALRLVHEETYSGSRTASVTVAPGSYDCSVVVSAYRAGALGPSYDSSVRINSVLVAAATGAIAQDADSDHAFQHFSLTIE
jgi:hypothetical protein